MIIYNTATVDWHGALLYKDLLFSLSIHSLGNQVLPIQSIRDGKLSNWNVSVYHLSMEDERLFVPLKWAVLLIAINSCTSSGLRLTSLKFATGSVTSVPASPPSRQRSETYKRSVPV